jgi:hypothetical protein
MFLGVLTLATAIASITALAVDPQDMKPGLWEYTMKMEMPGVPFAPPPQSARQCVTADDVAKGEVAPDPAQNQGNCEVRNFKRSAGTISYDVACPGSPPTTSQVKVTTTATTMEGTTIMDMGEHKMTTRMSGKRVGDCKG